MVGEIDVIETILQYMTIQTMATGREGGEREGGGENKLLL